MLHSYTTEFPVMIMFSSPKHFFKHAHDRNLTKRRMREVYRINKHGLMAKCGIENKKYFISFQYANKKIEPITIIENSLKKALIKLEDGHLKPNPKQ